MRSPKRILLASHGTEGARAAEKVAHSMCEPGTQLHHLIVVPDFWKGMMGDDWLNNASTREVYSDYVESELRSEVAKHIKRLEEETREHQTEYQCEVVVGKPTDCLIAAAKRERPDLIIMGSRRPKGMAGLRSRVHVDEVAASLPAPLLVVPYPHG